MIINDIMQLIGGDLSPEDTKALRKSSATLMWRGWLVAFSVMAFGGFGWVGWAGFVRADQVDQKISKQVGPLSQQVANLAQAVQSSAAAQNEQTLALLRVAITDGLVKKCHAAKEETKQIYRQQVAEAQARYFKLTGQYYPEHSCSDL